MSPVMMIVQMVRNWLGQDEEEGQGLVEYGLILALVSVVAIAILGTLGANVSTTFSSASASL